MNSSPRILSRSNSRHPAKSRRGATMVEMAVVSTVLFTILVGGIELSRIAMLRHSAEHAAYVGARRGIITGATSAQINTVVQDHMNRVGIRNVVVDVTPNVIQEDTVQVEVVVMVPLASNSWMASGMFGTGLRGRCTLLTERSASVMSQGMPAPPTPPIQ